jgi:DNA invertase Pin-like site-specific DNA recombinase
MKRAILLVRVSTEEQSLDEQQNDVLQRALSDGYRGGEILTIAYKESAIKLSDDERRGLNDMYAAIGVVPNPEYNPTKSTAGIAPYIRMPTENKIEIVYVWELSRLSRKELTLMLLKDYFCNNKIQFICVSQGIKLLDENGTISMAADMMFSIFAISCKTEMADKKNRFHRTKVAFARQGLFAGGKIKFGYRVDENNKYQINPKEAKLIQLIFDLYESGLSLTGITKELHERGITKLREGQNHRGNNLRATHVRRILSSLEYTGNNTGLQGISRNYPVIISMEQFEKCRRIAALNNTKANLKARYIYYCNGLIRCTCGRFWSAQHATKSYLCQRSRKNEEIEANFRDAGCKNKQSVSLNVIDSLCWHLVAHKEAVYLHEKARQDIEQLKAEIEVYQQKINYASPTLQKIQIAFDRSKELYKIGDIESEEYNSDKARFVEQQQQVRNNIINWNHAIKRLETVISTISNEYRLSRKMDERNAKTSLDERVELVRRISDDIMIQSLVRKHIKEIKIAVYKTGVSKVIDIHYVNGEVEKFVYDYRHISKKNADGRRCVTIYQVDNENNLKEIDYQFIERFK